MPWLHRPFGPHESAETFLGEMLPELRDLLGAGEKLLVHQDELGDRVQGLMAAFLRWAGMIDDGPTAVTVIERLLGRQLGPFGREMVAMATDVPGARA
jgi:hypothetical protein